MQSKREPARLSIKEEKHEEISYCRRRCVSVAAFGAPGYAADQPMIPVIVKDTTSSYWQIVFAGARQAGKDLGVKVPELGAQSESDINGEITILENAVAEKPAAVVIAPTQFKALGKPIDEAAKKVPIIGIDSAADSKAFTSFLTTDNVQGGRIAADGMAAGDQGQIRQGRGRSRAHHPSARRRLARGAQQGLQGRARREISRPEAGRRQGLRRQRHDRPQHHDRPDHRQPEPARRVRRQPDQGQGASQAIAENKKADTIKLVGFDADDKLIGFLKDGTIAALVAAGPLSHGL